MIGKVSGTISESLEINKELARGLAESREVNKELARALRTWKTHAAEQEAGDRDDQNMGLADAELHEKAQKSLERFAAARRAP
jgi:hypothetical protein